MKKTKEELKQIFNDTKRTCEVYVKSRPSTKKYGKDAVKEIKDTFMNFEDFTSYIES